jgi:hypothetical protein
MGGNHDAQDSKDPQSDAGNCGLAGDHVVGGCSGLAGYLPIGGYEREGYEYS